MLKYWGEEAQEIQQLMLHSPCHQRHSLPWWSHVSLGCIPDYAGQLFSYSFPTLLSSILLHSRCKHVTDHFNFYLKSNPRSPNGFSDREKLLLGMALYFWELFSKLPHRNICPCCAQKYMLLSYYLGQSWQNYSRNYSNQQHRPFSVRVPLDIFRCYQPCHITSCALPSTGANVHLNLDQVLEQLRLLPSKGQSGRMKDSCFKSLRKKKKLVSTWWGQSLN